jgi:flavin reductase (DIM6/NTAB) family NADH-FMN oxidoreductase RutF
MAYFSSNDIADLAQRYRTNLINGLSGFRPAVLVGTADASGHTNLSIFNSMIHIGANPPLIGLIFRPNTVERHSYENILSTEQYTINAVAKDQYKAAHQTSARYPKETSEFDACGFNAAYFEGFQAPAVADAPIRIGLSMMEKMEIQCNGTILVIGQVIHLSLQEEILQNDGHLRQDLAEIICCGGLDTYFQPAFLERLPYAKAPLIS